MKSLKQHLFDSAMSLLPPMLTRRLIHRFLMVRYCGNYANWAEASSASFGYDTPLILEQVLQATKAVADNPDAVERDGVVVGDVTPPWPLLYAVALGAATVDGDLHVTDFGGSLGSLYRLTSRFKPSNLPLRWSVVEQEAFVAAGREHFETEDLRFFARIAECHETLPAHLLLLSSVLAYLEEPYVTLKELLSYRYPIVVLDRTQLLDSVEDRLTVQRLPRSFYGRSVSYPAWLLSDRKLKSVFVEAGYELLVEQDASIMTNSPGIVGHRDVAMIWLRKDEATGDA